MATLLPPGKQQFLDSVGSPLASGLVYFWVPNTTTPKDTWQDSGQLVLNTNPIVLDGSGEAIIYGSGTYRQAVYDSSGNLIWDQLTASTDTGGLAWGGTSSGSANAQVISASSFSQQDGQQVAFLAGLTNTGACTITLGTGSPIAVLKDTLSGPTTLTGGEITTDNAVMMIYDAARGAFHLIEYPQQTVTGALTDIAGGTTINLGSLASRNANVTGSGWTCTSFGSSASTSAPIYYLTFVSTGTLTYDGTALILPGRKNISVAAGDTAIAMYLGSGNWRVIVYTVASVPVDAYQYLGTQLFTSNSTYTPTTGCRYIRVTCIGGGGAGGGANSGTINVGAGGGGEGSTSIYIGAPPSPNASVTIGTGGAGSSGAGGGNGTDTSLGALCIGKGGSGAGAATTGGIFTAFAGGAGGVSGTGTITMVGQAGNFGMGAGSGGDDSAAGGTGGGHGGRGGATAITGVSAAGSAGGKYGGGGGGGMSSVGGGSVAGGNGADGVCWVDEYA